MVQKVFNFHYEKNKLKTATKSHIQVVSQPMRFSTTMYARSRDNNDLRKELFSLQKNGDDVVSTTSLLFSLKMTLNNKMIKVECWNEFCSLGT